MFWSGLCSSRKRCVVDEDFRFDTQIEQYLSGIGQFKTLEEMERSYIQQVLRKEHGRVRAAAKKLGIPRSSLYHKLKQYKTGSTPRLPTPTSMEGSQLERLLVDVQPHLLKDAHASAGHYCPIELATDEKTLFELPPINRTVPTTRTRITASITAYSAIS